MSLPYARTDDEARLYINLRPCFCGDPDLTDLAIKSDDVDDQTVIKQFSGDCTGCGRLRRFTFQMPRLADGVPAEVQYGVGDEPSRLLDAGEWRGIAALFATSAQEAIEADEPIDGRDTFRVYYELTSAVAAMDEVFKFLPPGEESIPESAFTSRDGRIVYETTPERLTRQRLTTDRYELRQLLDDFIEKYGEEGDADEDEDSTPAPPSPVVSKTPPVASTADEAEVYIALHPCEVCGEDAFDRPAWMVEVDGDPAARYAGPCPRCGTAREFIFRVLDDQPFPAADEPRFGNEQPSELPDAGQWLWLADRIAGSRCSSKPTVNGQSDSPTDSRDWPTVYSRTIRIVVFRQHKRVVGHKSLALLLGQGHGKVGNACSVLRDLLRLYERFACASRSQRTAAVTRRLAQRYSK